MSWEMVGSERSSSKWEGMLIAWISRAKRPQNMDCHPTSEDSLSRGDDSIGRDGVGVVSSM